MIQYSPQLQRVVFPMSRKVQTMVFSKKTSDLRNLMVLGACGPQTAHN
jgi:hypothetical protein